MNRKQWDFYATEYHTYIISPFQERVRNPIYDDLKKIKNKNLVVADIGTGNGDFLPFLSDHFKEVYAVDFSEKMLNSAKKKNAKLKNVKYSQQDIRNLKLKTDVIIASNSVLHPTLKDVKRSLKSVYNSLADNGILYGIFPSMESIIYQFQLIYDREYKKYKSEKKALSNTKRIAERRKYNLITGIYEDDNEKQKLFYEFELRKRLKEAGFKNITFKKVIYPWGEETGDFEDFSDEPGMWDWYITARK